MTRVLLTRPRADSLATAARLAARGIDSVVAPLLEIVPAAGAAAHLDGVQAVLVTSANGARALAAATGRRDAAVLAVGPGSAAAARKAGFAQVESAGGDVAALASLARRRCDPGAGPLLHAAGSVRAGDLARTLEGAGFAVRRAVLYRALRVAALPAPARRALAAGGVSHALFYSPRTAAAFADLAAASGLAGACRGVAALCLSAAVAARLSPLAFHEVRTAARPRAEALLALLDADRAAPSVGPAFAGPAPSATLRNPVSPVHGSDAGAGNPDPVRPRSRHRAGS